MQVWNGAAGRRTIKDRKNLGVATLLNLQEPPQPRLKASLDPVRAPRHRVGALQIVERQRSNSHGPRMIARWAPPCPGNITMVMQSMAALAKSRLTAQGQISVPAEVRRKLGLGPGSVLEWEAVGEQMLVRRAGSFSSQDLHRALFPVVPPKRTLQDLKLGVARHLQKRHARG